MKYHNIQKKDHDHNKNEKKNHHKNFKRRIGRTRIPPGAENLDLNYAFHPRETRCVTFMLIQ